MYDFLRGPMVWVSVLICLVGLTVQGFRILRITGKAHPRDVHCAGGSEAGNCMIRFIAGMRRFFGSDRRILFAGTIVGSQPLFVAFTVLFHGCLIIAPLFVLGHAVLIYESWGWAPCALSEFITDIMTMIVLISCAIFAGRRILSPTVKRITTWYDYVLLMITAAPFITGLCAYHQLFDYKTAILSHMAAGELMLIALGTTKLGHMVFFFFVRLLVNGEHALGRGRRSW